MSSTHDLIARLWERFAPLAHDRVGTVARYVRDQMQERPGLAAPGTAATSEPPTHAQARQAAHDLVGSLGSYGRPRGSELAARVEALLGDGVTPMSPADLREAHRLVDDLDQEVSS